MDILNNTVDYLTKHDIKMHKPDNAYDFGGTYSGGKEFGWRCILHTPFHPDMHYHLPNLVVGTHLVDDFNHMPG
jgi:hypothetical protein